MKQGEEGRSLYRFKAPVALLGMSAAVARQREKKKKQQWIDKELQIIPLKIQWRYFLLFVNSSGPSLCH